MKHDGPGVSVSEGTRLEVWRCEEHGLLSAYNVSTEGECLVVEPGGFPCLQEVEQIAVVPESRIHQLEGRVEELEGALDELFVAFIRMPDAGFNSRSPRWKWWHETHAARAKALAALRTDHQSED